MRIRRLSAFVARLPLKRPFRHASATRLESENILIKCELASGIIGWGEGVPRSYVTGETPAGCLAQLAATPVAEQLTADCSSWPEVIALCERFQPMQDRDDPRGCYGNALRCAVELSVLDAFGRLFGEPVSAVSSHVPEAQPILAHPQPTFVRYGVVIDSGNRRLRLKALTRRLYGFRDCKVKVGAAEDDDRARLRTIRRWFGPAVDLRIDANEAWRADRLQQHLNPLLAQRISCVEQPVPHAEVACLAELRPKLGVPIMLDESLTSETDAREAIAHRTCDLFNLRLSKCGGFLRCLRLAALANHAKLGYQLGCHPGESGILSAAGRHWACSVANIRYLEGSYDRHLFRKLLTNEDATFGFGGRAPSLHQPGLGVSINLATLEQTTQDHLVCKVL
ncbi:MAG: dipeptide epimerase [Pirellulales bacterium]|nr:dipeptide epimerase [Pirellulales bacterium]